MTTTLTGPSIQHNLEYGSCSADAGCNGFHWDCSCGASGNANATAERNDEEALVHVPRCDVDQHTVDCYTGVRRFPSCELFDQ